MWPFKKKRAELECPLNKRTGKHHYHEVKKEKIKQSNDSKCKENNRSLYQVDRYGPYGFLLIEIKHYKKCCHCDKAKIEYIHHDDLSDWWLELPDGVKE